MTAEEIMQIVTQEAFDMSYSEINHLHRYFIKKHLSWLSYESIGKKFNVSQSNVCRSIKEVETNRNYQFAKARIQLAINLHLKSLINI